MSRWRGVGAALVVGLAMPASSAAQVPDTIPLAERVWMASNMYASVERYFGHWQAIPEYDLDAAYRAYLNEITTAADRRSFALSSMAFLATLQNGHSNFTDGWLWEREGAAPGFEVRRLGEAWVVSSSRRPELAAGDEIVAVDGVRVGDFVRERIRYAHGSSARVRELRVFRMPYLFPARFRLRLKDGREVDVARGEGLGPAAPSRLVEDRVLRGDVAYVSVPSFEDPSFEQRALSLVKAHAGAPAVIIDVRRNGGGTTPVSLIEALMDRPYVEWTEATVASNALFGAYRVIKESYTKAQLGEYVSGYVDGLASFDRAMFSTLGRLVKPGAPVYTGRLIVLIDGGCASACEDFVMPLKVSGRATLVGESTQGSTGQPYLRDFGNGMSFRISTKRVSFPDGRAFEGVGIEPDILVQPTPADLRAGRDVVLERALELAGAGDRPAGN